MKRTQTQTGTPEGASVLPLKCVRVVFFSCCSCRAALKIVAPNFNSTREGLALANGATVCYAGIWRTKESS